MPNTTQYFNRNKNSKDGLETKCKECMKQIKLKRYKNIIYELYCIPTNTYYIGQTIKPLNDRISKHFSDAKRGRMQPLYDDIRLYGRENFTYKEIEFVKDRDKMDDREKYWINYYITNGFKIYNRELGGTSNCIVTTPTKILMSKRYGITPFLVFDKDRNFIGKFSTITEASNKLNISHSSIGGMLNRTAKHCGNYVIIYEKDYNNNPNALNEIFSKLIIDKNNNLRTYVNLSGQNNPMSKINRAKREQGKEVSYD